MVPEEPGEDPDHLEEIMVESIPLEEITVMPVNPRVLELLVASTREDFSSDQASELVREINEISGRHPEDEELYQQARDWNLLIMNSLPRERENSGNTQRLEETL